MSLPRAMAGEESAIGVVAMYVLQRWGYMADRLYSNDQALDRDDLRSEFLEGVLRAIPKVDHRGDPLFHLAQRGQWRVMRVINHAMALRRQPTLRVLSLTEDLVAESSDDPIDTALDQIFAFQRVVHITADPILTETMRKMMSLILSGAVGEPDEIGFNKRLAEAMSFSQQRCSAVFRKMREVIAA